LGLVHASRVCGGAGETGQPFAPARRQRGHKPADVGSSGMQRNVLRQRIVQSDISVPVLKEHAASKRGCGLELRRRRPVHGPICGIVSGVQNTEQVFHWSRFFSAPVQVLQLQITRCITSWLQRRRPLEWKRRCITN